jgi:hypothetical protein
MTENAPMDTVPALRRLDTPAAAKLSSLAAKFEDLQTVLRCCERLVSELRVDPGGEVDDVVVEGVWTVALLSYARCFTSDGTGTTLTENDLTETLSNDHVATWHKVLMQLRDHHGDPKANPRERFSVGVSQDDDGAAAGIAITSARQPLVDDVTVRQTGAIAFAMSRLVNDRIVEAQAKVFDEVRDSPKADLDRLELLDVAVS